MLDGNMVKLKVLSMDFDKTCRQHSEGFPGSIVCFMSWVRISMLPQHELLQEVPGGFANFIKVFLNEFESICWLGYYINIII